MLMPMPNHGTVVDMDGHTMVVTGMERGLLMPNPHPMLMPRPNHGTMEDMDMDMDGPIMVTLITVRGLLMPSLPPTLMPSPNRGGMAATEHMPGPTMVTPTGVKLIGPKH